MKGLLYFIGLGPGDRAQRTFQAEEALERSAVIVGYQRYLALLGPRPIGQRIISSEISQEVDRAKQALDLAAAGQVVALVSGGDVGICAMAGVVFEVLAKRGWRPGERLDIEVIPDVSAAPAAAAPLEVPLMHDFGSISLSDLLTPWEQIATRLDKAAQADFILCLYSPASQRRTWQLAQAHRVLLRQKDPHTPVGIVTNAYREGQNIAPTNLGKILEHAIDIRTIVVVGNAETFVLGDRMVTPRGHRRYQPCR